MNQLTDIDRTLSAPRLPHGLDTPVVVVDLDRVDANIARMQAHLDERGVALRPHAKTHKSPFFAQLQLEAGAVGITVATLGEAQVMADAGIDDVFVAYPLWAVGDKAGRLQALAGRVRLAVGADSVEGVRQLGRAVAGSSARLEVMIEVDSGEGRTGTDAARAVEVARAVTEAGLTLRGVFTHGGHAYRGPDRVAGAAEDEGSTLGAVLRALLDAGFEVPVVSAGSTPTAVASAAAPITEERPGTYVFGDRQQANLGGSDPATLALAVAATVVSTAVPGRCVLDSGAKMLAKDKPDWLAGHGVVPQLPGAVIRSVYDHHAVVDLADDAPPPRVGDIVAVVPNHACPVVNLTDELLLTRAGEVVERLPVLARGRNG
ncbi:MAG: alanine racemase [Actinobacteria bacterium]|jgi:D-serine deaminase-like pyridoxal phosphate-dependent protein|nr:alanine racemase [Actinomycetota bacterium]